ncbi:MAG: tyrosine-protein phosphatase [Anaerolineae bacterium]|jgi:protein-tyrosine phosphatase|nr:tyrosine-protein phosphatase [Anaerolineae bacterium]
MWGFLLILSVLIVGGVALWFRRQARRQRRVYPDPLTLIIDPDPTPLDPPRLIPLQGGINFRDIGGYPTADGRKVKRGQIFRSGTLIALTDHDWATLARFEIKLVCDFRSPEEVIEEPEKLPAGIDYWHAPLQTPHNTINRLRMVLFQPDRLSDFLLQTYTEIMLDQNPQLLGNLITRLSDQANLPTLIHCTAGKDRTGMAIALVLLALGVSEDIVIADYTLSNRNYSDYQRYVKKVLKRLAWFGVTANDLYSLLIADAKVMRAALDYLKAKYGSVERYLTDDAGVQPEAIERLKAHLLE